MIAVGWSPVIVMKVSCTAYLVGHVLGNIFALHVHCSVNSDVSEAAHESRFDAVDPVGGHLVGPTAELAARGTLARRVTFVQR